MDHTGSMRRPHPCADGACHRERDIDGQPFALHARSQRLALHQLHGEQTRAFVLADVEHARDVRMGDTSGELHLAPKPLQLIFALTGSRLQDLERPQLVELAIAGLVDVSHPAAAE